MSGNLKLENVAGAVLVKKKDDAVEASKGIKIVFRGDDGKLDFSQDGLIIWKTDLEVLLKYGRWADVYKSEPLKKTS